MAKRRGKLFVFFADLKIAFDKVDRLKLGEMLEKAGIYNQLRKRIMETYKEIRNSIKTEDKSLGEFWTKAGVRQRCPISLALFNIHIYYKFRIGNGKQKNRGSNRKKKVAMVAIICR